MRKSRKKPTLEQQMTDSIEFGKQVFEPDHTTSVAVTGINMGKESIGRSS